MSSFGTVQHNGKTLTLTQEACLALSGDLKTPVYLAHAMDDDDKEYTVKWQVKDVQCENEPDACAWSKYTIIEM